jgi:hypothetical protein
VERADDLRGRRRIYTVAVALEALRISDHASALLLVLAGALAGSAGVRATVLIGAGLSVLSCGVIFVPGVRDPERADYAPAQLPG